MIRLQWRFLLKALKALGFNEVARDLIFRNICSIAYSFYINGEIVGRVNATRGVRQGDPLSPLLFVLAQQVLSLNLQKLINTGRIGSYKVGRNEMSLSHLLYAEAVLLFTNGSSRSLHAPMGLLHSYEKSSRQSVSLEKSSFYVGRKAAHRATQIRQITGMVLREFPIRYLGVPIFAGRSKLFYFEHLVDKVHRKLEGWKAQLLNFAGKLTLIKSVLSSMHTYTLASTNVPSTTIKRIEQIMFNFLWHSKGENRVHWVNWNSVCVLKKRESWGLNGSRRYKSVSMENLYGVCCNAILYGGDLQGLSTRDGIEWWIK